MDKKTTLDIDREHIWHPFTQMKDYEDFGHVPIQRARGIMLYDMDGREYYDTISSWWTNTHGHNHPRMVSALKDQLDILHHVNFSGFTHPYAATVVDEMRKVMDPGLGRYFFSDDGSTAMEVSIKMAFQYFKNRGQDKKQKFVHLSDSYHGDTIGSLSVGGIEVYHISYHSLMFDSLEVASPIAAQSARPMPDYTLDASDPAYSLEGFEKIEKILREHATETAAVVLEPLLMGSAGMQVYHPVYLQKLRELTRELDILLIFDEVVTGFGRTGEMFAYKKAGVVPDIVAFAKGLTGGVMSLSLTVCTETIYQAFYDEYLKLKTFFHGHSYTANPLACVAASTNLKIFHEEDTLNRMDPAMKYFQSRVAQFATEDYVDDIRYIGWAGAIDIVREKAGHPGAGQAFAPELRTGLAIYRESLRNGLVLRPLGDTIYWMLPLVTTEKDIDIIMDRSREVIRTVVHTLRKG